MFQSTLQTLSFVAVILASTEFLVLLVRSRRASVKDRSRHIACYYRDLKKIDEQERKGLFSESVAEEARIALLKNTNSQMPQSRQWAAHSLVGKYKHPIFALLLAGVFSLIGMSMTPAQPDQNASKNSRGTNSQLASSQFVARAATSLGLISVAMAAEPASEKTLGNNSSASKTGSNDVTKLQKYLDSIGAKSAQFDFLDMFSKTAGSGSKTSPTSTPPSLPGVDVMIERLAARLKKSPNDVEGWRMLGWSYFNTKKYAQSVAAYEQALKLNPGASQLQTALDKAKSKISTGSAGQKKAAAAPAKSAADKTAATKSKPTKSAEGKTASDKSALSKTAPAKTAQSSTAKDKVGAKGMSEANSKTAKPAQTGDSLTPQMKVAKGPTAQDIEASKAMLPADRQAMILGMVNGLAARLEKSPRDAKGWQRLIHSRVVLGDKPAARKALARALEVFASEPKVKATILAAAEKSGVKLTTTN